MGSDQEATLSPTPSPTPQTISTSPNGKFIVRREKAESTTLGLTQKRIEICNDSGREIYSWISALGATTFLWSPDSSYLAVNDMPGEAGDIVRLFQLGPEASVVTPLREPDGKKLLDEEEARHGSFLSKVDEVHLRAIEWRDGHLWCLLTGSCHPKREPTVHIPFHHLWVFGVNGKEVPDLLQEWTLTDPRETPVRDAGP